MNVPGIRAALEQMKPRVDHPMASDPISDAVVRIGQRACDEWDEVCSFDPDDYDVDYLAGIKRGLMSDLRVIADILREAGVEVSE